MISLVIPARNEAMLPETVESALMAGADEVVVIDDCSQPPVALKRDHVVVHRVTAAQGPSHCRNLGGQLAKGDVVVYSDAHVLFSPGALSTIAELARANDTVVCGAVKAMGGTRDWTGYGGVVVSIGQGGLDVKYNRDPKRKDPTGYIGSVYGATRACWDAIGWWPTTLSWGYNEQALSLAVLYSGRRPVVAPTAVCEHMFKKRFNYPVQQSMTRVNRLLVHYQLCADFKTRWLPGLRLVFRQETATFERLLERNRVEWGALREKYAKLARRTDDEVRDLILAGEGDKGNRMAANRRVDTPPDPNRLSVCLFTAFAPGREHNLTKWARHVEMGGPLIDGRVFMLDNPRPDVENYAREVGAIVLQRPPRVGGDSESTANHLADHWNTALPFLRKFDLILSVEDDVFPPRGYLAELISAITNDPANAIAGAPVKSRLRGHTMAYQVKSIEPYEIDSSWQVPNEGRHLAGSVSLSCTLIRTAALDPEWKFTGQPNLTAGAPSGNRGHEFSLMKHVLNRNGRIIACCDLKCEHRVLDVNEPTAPIAPAKQPRDSFVSTRYCSSRMHCAACRNSQTFRNAVRQQYQVPADWDTNCPNGIRGGTRSTLEMAATAAKAVGQAIMAVASGRNVVSKRATILSRWATCNKCGWLEGKHRRCKQCGCFLDAKIQLAFSVCPAGLWAAEPDADPNAPPLPRHRCGGCSKRHPRV
jgi:glycosyltransferase involved in cell wall biosynthesis